MEFKVFFQCHKNDIFKLSLIPYAHERNTPHINYILHFFHTIITAVCSVVVSLSRFLSVSGPHASSVYRKSNCAIQSICGQPYETSSSSSSSLSAQFDIIRIEAFSPQHNLTEIIVTFALIDIIRKIKQQQHES